MASGPLRSTKLAVPGGHMVQNKATWVPRFVGMEFPLHTPWAYSMKHAVRVATLQVYTFYAKACWFQGLPT